MAGRPKARLRKLQQEAIARGEEPPTELPPAGNGTWKSIADMTPEEKRRMHANSRESMKRNRRVRKLMEEEAYLEAHRELGLEIIESRIELMRTLRMKAVVAEVDEDGELTGREVFDPTRLDKDERRDYMKILEQLDMRGRGTYTQKHEHEATVNVSHQVLDMRKALEKGEKLMIESPHEDPLLVDAEIVDEEE